MRLDIFLSTSLIRRAGKSSQMIELKDIFSGFYPCSHDRMQSIYLPSGSYSAKFGWEKWTFP